MERRDRNLRRTERRLEEERCDMIVNVLKIVTFCSSTCRVLSSKFIICYLGFPGGSDGKASACSAGDPGSIPGSRRSPGEGNGTPLQSSCLENSMDQGA